jgi:hypothetical protein
VIGLRRFVALGSFGAFAVLAGCSKSSGEKAEEKTADSALENQVPPLEDESDLQQRARDLFQAIVKDDPALAEPFWFPREPFIPLKDPPNPAGYWEKLHHAYEDDIHWLHRTRESWEGATFEHFELGSPARWMNPGDEHNRIGYYRSLGGSIQYRLGEKRDSFVVDVIITWQGRWYVTHLRRVRK